MGVSKVEYGDTTLIDLTNDTVTEDTLKKGFTAHGADGELIEGQMEDGANVVANPEDEATDVLYKLKVEDETYSVGTSNVGVDVVENTLVIDDSTSNKVIHRYTLGEQIIGTWIDGKTLYETTIVSTNRPDGSEGCPVYDLSELNIDSVANMFGAMYLDVGASRPVIMPLPSYIQRSNQIGLDIDATNKVAITMTNMWIQYIDHWVLTIQYTKL